MRIGTGASPIMWLLLRKLTLFVALAFGVNFIVACWACNSRPTDILRNGSVGMICGTGITFSDWMVFGSRDEFAISDVEVLHSSHTPHESWVDKAELEELDRIGLLSVLNGKFPPGTSYSIWQARMCGWPCRSMAAVHDLRVPETGTRTIEPPVTVTWRAGADPLVIPSVFLWKGSAINTAFYGGLLGVPMLVFGPVRAARRRRRGRCPRCAYDLRSGQLAGCPECGWGRASAYSSTISLADSPSQPSVSP